MKNKNNLIALLLTIVLGIAVVFIATRGTSFSSPIEVYKVYLNGKTIGYIKSKEELLELIDQKQNEIKDKYQINKVYPPKGLNIEKVTTYHNDIKTAEEIYNKIEQTEPFTIEGYIVTIKYPDKDREPLIICTLNKEAFEEAFYNTVAAFVGAEQLDAYKNNTQDEIKDEGERIESVYWEEDVTIKKGLISNKATIFTTAEKLSKYILFGTTEKQKTYTVKDGDNITDIIEKNNLSIEEFLVANPNIPDKDILLSKGQEVSIGLIAPVITVVHEVEKVEKITNKFETEYKTDSSLYRGSTKVIQEGTNGVDRVTEKIQFKNGDINQLYISKSEKITPTVNKIIAKGTKSYSTITYDPTYAPDLSGDDFLWPTIKPYIITSRFAWRWGKHHNGIDISGCGFGSPIYSTSSGTVVAVVNHCGNTGSYGNSCGNYWGNHVDVQYGNYKFIYAHLKSDVRVKVGQTVSRGQQLGTMGSSGSSTGTHLHFGVVGPNGNYLNPCSLLKC